MGTAERVLLGLLVVLVLIGVLLVSYGLGWDAGHHVGKFDAQWECRQQRSQQ